MAASTFEQPGRLGRGVRLVAGMTLLALFIETLLDPTDWLRETAPTSPGLWIGAAMCFYFLRGVPDKGFGRSWGRWPQLMVGVLALVASFIASPFLGIGGDNLSARSCWCSFSMSPDIWGSRLCWPACSASRVEKWARSLTSWGD